jgi:hypothetical protein
VHQSPIDLAAKQRADAEVHAVLLEPMGAVNTGDAGGPMAAGYDDALA